MQIYLVSTRDYIRCNNEDCSDGHYEKYFRGAFSSKEEAQAYIDSFKYYEYKYKGEIRRKPRAEFNEYSWDIEEVEMEL